MRAYGRLVVGGEQFKVILDENLSRTSAYLYRDTHKEDLKASILGQPLQHPVFKNFGDFRGSIPEEYLAEAVTRHKVTGETKSFGMYRLLRVMFDLLSLANSYSFKKSNVTRDDHVMIDGNLSKVYNAKDNEVELDFTRVGNKYYHHIRVVHGLNRLELSVGGYTCKPSCTWSDVEVDEDKIIRDRVQLKRVTLADLERIYDLSWLQGKDYRSIKTIDDFEELVINDIIKEYHKCVEKGEELLLSLDTETDGLNVNYLSDDNPLKSHICATPLSWKDNQAVVVFNNMDKFDNVPKEYMFERLRDLLEFGDNIRIELKRTGENLGTEELTRMSLGNQSNESSDSISLDRRKINLIGHNVLFDGKVLFDNGVEPYWNNDTMQMAFNLNPKAAKGKYNNKLKGLTRRLFNHETPELTEILGKGNEDKYRYLTDEDVAIIYGCADADYTRLVYKELRDLMSDHAYAVYQAQDMEMLNELYISEYYGLLMDEKKVSELADKTEHDLIRIHEFLKNYIGIMVQKHNKYTEVVNRYKMGELTDEDFRREVSEIRVDSKAKYEFEMKASDYQKILFELLKYPIVSYTGKEGDKNRKPATDKFVMKKLSSQKLEQPSNQMKEDLKSDDGERTLIKAKEFNKLKYPVAYVLQQYKVLEKEFTSYLKPIRDQNMESRLFKGYSLSRIETFRIMNPSQTMKSELKGLTLPFDGGKDWYMVDFDMAQVEYRIMVSIAGQMEMVERLRDPEKDFHTESASALKGIPAHTVDKAFRKQMKAVHFGIPYGLGDHSLCETMFGKVTDSTLYETRKLKEGFCERNDKVIAMLEHHRDEALIPRNFSNKFKEFCGMFEDVEDEFGNVQRVYKPVGWVKNEMGRYRLFDLSDLDNRKIGTIRRAAGNFPIQAFAAELFRKILLNFRQRCIKEGIKDKIIWHMLIHDELLLSAHKSINPFYLYKLILEECMVTIEGHTEYFVGINMGRNWKDCKDDLAEAPVLFVREMVRRWDEGEFVNDTWIDDAKSYVDKYKVEFIKQRIHDVIKELQPNLDNEPIDFNNIRKNMSNYMVRAYITDFYIPQVLLETGKWWGYSDDEKLLLALSNWSHRYFGDSKMIDVGKGRLVNANSFGITDINPHTLEYEIGELDLDDFDDFLDEEGEAIDDYFFDIVTDKSQYDASTGEFVTLGVKRKTEPEHLRLLNNNIVIKVPRTFMVNKVKSVLRKHLAMKGIPVIIKTPRGTERWGHINKDLVNNEFLLELDGLISEVI